MRTYIERTELKLARVIANDNLACLCRISPEVSVVREALLPREQPSHILQVQWPLPAPDTSQV